MTYRVYLRWPNQRISDKTVTASSSEAESAFRKLLSRFDLIGKPVAAVLSLGGRQLEYCRFDRSDDCKDGLKRHDAEIRLFHSD